MYEVQLPATLLTISEDAFAGCSRLSSINLPPTLTKIGVRAFSSCSALKSINLPESLLIIDSSAFSNSRFSELAIPGNVKQIGANAFYQSWDLVTLHLGASLTEIGSEAFRLCSKLKTVYSDAVTPPTLGWNVFDWIDKEAILWVPTGCKDAYAASEWSQYFNNIQEGVENGINDVISNGSSDITEYYELNGRRLSKAPDFPGFYILKRGNNRVKLRVN